jgi:hypothetical protein
MEFSSKRFDAVTCTSTCRQRLRRGQAFAYLDGMNSQEQETERWKHRRIDAFIAYHRATNLANRKERFKRNLPRHLKNMQRMAREELADLYLAEQRHGDAWHFKKMQVGVAGALQLFLKQRRNDFSAEAIAQFFHDVPGYTVEAVSDAIEVMKQEGHYDRIMSGEFQTLQNWPGDSPQDEPESEGIPSDDGDDDGG